MAEGGCVGIELTEDDIPGASLPEPLKFCTTQQPSTRYCCKTTMCFLRFVISNSLVGCKLYCTGLVYSYLAEGTGNVSGSGAFRALQRGFNHWSCGRISHIEVNVEHPQFCHVRCHMTPSIKPGVYHVSILLRRDNELAVVERAICQCAAG